MANTNTAVANTLKRILRITSHVGLSRYLGSLTGGNLGYILRQDIPSPYAYSPTHIVHHDPKRGAVIVVETSHKRFDVFAVDHDVTTVYATEALAMKGGR